MKKVIFQIDGMSCQGCVGKVNAALENLDGVAEYNVSLENKQAEVNFDSEKLDANSIRTALKKTNFEISLIKHNTDTSATEKTSILGKIKSVFN